MFLICLKHRLSTLARAHADITQFKNMDLALADILIRFKKPRANSSSSLSLPLVSLTQ